MSNTIGITGASRGIGAATARRLAVPGRTFVLIARGEAALNELAQELTDRGATVHCIAADLADADGLAAVNERLAQFPLDTLILNAGFSTNRDFAESESADREYEMRLNYFAPTEILARVLPQMKARGGGRIIATGSLTALVPFPGNASYAASKGALLSFLRSLQSEVRGSGVTVTTILPGLVKTELTEGLSAPFLWLVPAQTAEDVAREVERNLKSGPAVVIPGPANAMMGALFQLLPDVGNLLIDIFGPLVVPRRKADAGKSR